MPKSFKLTIPEPCQQNWDDMLPDGNQRHCTSCEKMVIDFASFSDKQLTDWFAKNSGNVCGRFAPGQLERAFFPHTSFSLKRFKPGLIAASIFAFLSLPKLSSAQTIKTGVIQTDDFKGKYVEKKEPVVDFVRKIRGIVVDKEDKSRLAGAVLSLDDKRVLTTTNMKGEFEFALPKDINTHKIELTVRFIGYESLTKSLTIKDIKPLNIELCMGQQFMGEVTVVSDPMAEDPSILNRIKYLFNKIVR
ncbi:carboxypeptidase-like regulatory domain-containing protein [Pedobacter sp. MW01-1-1]|uniref:carboxypeptidase-like regulatory domain-containing protein n=1 Tax=Pedobacter sp. MW01-1-1 TaxID=3383027 RepID=UPI003FEE469B